VIQSEKREKGRQNSVGCKEELIDRFIDSYFI